MSINPRRSNCFNFEYLSTNQATLVTKSDIEEIESLTRKECLQINEMTACKFHVFTSMTFELLKHII